MATNPLHIVAGFKVRTPSQMRAFIDRVAQAIRLESRKGRGGSFPLLQNLQKQVKRLPQAKVAKMAPFFYKIRDYATQSGAPQTAAAVVQAASWFSRNVEQPGRGRAAAPSGGFQPSADTSGGDVAPPPTGKLPLTQRTWFWPTVIGGSGLLVVGLILAVPGKEK